MNFKYVMMACATFSLMGLASCSEDPGQNKGTEEGQETTVTISLKQDGAATRAVAPKSATDEENKIYSATVYVFSLNKVLQDIQKFSDDDLSANKKTFKTTTGDHYFLAVANAPVVNVPIGTSLDNLTQTINSLQQAEF